LNNNRYELVFDEIIHGKELMNYIQNFRNNSNFIKKDNKLYNLEEEESNHPSESEEE
jgi:hypothetical protein